VRDATRCGDDETDDAPDRARHVIVERVHERVDVAVGELRL
jgi:hypothetical protein